jgi:hypothetical protein
VVVELGLEPRQHCVYRVGVVVLAHKELSRRFLNLVQVCL